MFRAIIMNSVPDNDDLIVELVADNYFEAISAGTNELLKAQAQSGSRVAVSIEVQVIPNRDEWERIFYGSLR